MPWREQFPSLEDDIERRIEHSEGRIKYWVIAGILANLVALVGIGIPLVYYFGSMQAQSVSAASSLSALTNNVALNQNRLQSIEFRQQMLEVWAESEGFRAPKVSSQ